MTTNCDLVALLQNVFADLTPRNVQVCLNSWLRDVIGCKQSAFCVTEEDQCFVNVIGTDVLSTRVEVGKIQQWRTAFQELSDLRFEVLPQSLKQYVYAVFKSQSKGCWVTLHTVCKDKNGALTGILLILHPPSTENQASQPKSLRVHVDIASTLIQFSISTQRRLNRAHFANAILEMFNAVFENPDEKFYVAEALCETVRRFVSCENCRLFWVDNERNEFVYFKKNADLFQSIIQQQRFPMYEGLLREVFSTLRIANSTRRKSHNESNSTTVVRAAASDQCDDDFSLPFTPMCEVVKITNSENQLWFALLENAQIMAIVQVTKTYVASGFTNNEKNVVKLLQPFLTSCLSQSQRLNRLHEENSRPQPFKKSLSLSTLRIADEDVLTLSLWEIRKPEDFSPNFTTLNYTALNLSTDQILKACLIIFSDMGLIESLKIERKTLARFLLTLQRSHRNLAYHNWNNAYLTAHFCFVLMKKVPELRQLFNDVELMSIFITCLCFGIDYRGSRDQLLLAGEILQSDNESDPAFNCHNFEHISCILGFGETNIFSEMPSNYVEKSLKIIKEALEAGRLTNYFRIRPELLILCETGIDPSKGGHQLVRSLVMIACYLSYQVKPWDVSKARALHFYEELFIFGDLAKTQDHKPRAVMERDQVDIVKLQIQCLDVVVLPIFKILGTLFPKVICCYESASRNLLCYETMKQLIRRGGFRASKGDSSALMDASLEKAVLSIASEKWKAQTTVQAKASPLPKDNERLL